jgi:hypothetical protein
MHSAASDPRWWTPRRRQRAREAGRRGRQRQLLGSPHTAYDFTADLATGLFLFLTVRRTSSDWYPGRPSGRHSPGSAFERG